MDKLDFIFSMIFYICGILLIIIHILDGVFHEDNIKGAPLTNGLLFIILAILV
jgi:hypothetical protein